MSKKMMLLALAAVSAALFALPAVASAGTWNMTPAGSIFTLTSKVGTTTVWTSTNHTVTCASVTGSGRYNVGSPTNGVISLKFHGCKDEAGTTCTGETAGEPAGTLSTTANMPFSNIYMESEKGLAGSHNPGITISGVGAEKHFMNFRCGFGLLTVKIEGSIIAELEGPCNTALKTHALNLESPKGHGKQEWTQVTTTGTIDDLTSTVNGSPETLSLDGTWFMHFEGATTADCTL
jgi:hypothetical protein